MVYLYDDNHISLDGPTEWSYEGEDVAKRFEAYRWHVQMVGDANDLNALEVAIDDAMREEERPSLIRVRSIIGWPAPNKQNTSKAHGAPLGEDEVRRRRRSWAGTPTPTSSSPTRSASTSAPSRAAAPCRASGGQRFRAWREAHPDLAREWDPPGQGARSTARPTRCARSTGARTSVATRAAGQKVDGRVQRTCRRWSAAPPTSASRRRPSSRTTSASRRASRAATCSGACASTAWAARSTAWPRTAASSARTGRRSCSSPTTCAARCA